MVIEVRLDDIPFIFLDDNFDSGDIISWVEEVNMCEVSSSGLAILTISKS